MNGSDIGKISKNIEYNTIIIKLNGKFVNTVRLLPFSGHVHKMQLLFVEYEMYLAWNTRRLLGLESTSEFTDSCAIEYHLNSWRELYDKSILTADRYSSGSARWIIRGDQPFYTVTVVSHPYYSLPQELCLSFNCFSLLSKTDNVEQEWFPIEQVALEFAVLLSVFAREPLLPLGLRRQAGEPLADKPYKTYPPRFDRVSTPVPFGIKSPEFTAVVSGLAKAKDDLVRALIGAAKFYHVGLLQEGFDPSVAYVSFVSAIECLASYYYKDSKFEFDSIPKFQKIQQIIERINKKGDLQKDVAQLKEELIRSERFLRQKFVLFLKEFVPKVFWDIPDELYEYQSAFPEITRDTFEQSLRLIYDTRSTYLHGGLPFPDYVDFGLRERFPSHVFSQLMELKQKKKFIPPLGWFERLSHAVMVEYMRRFLAPELAKSDFARLEEKERLLKTISELPQNVQESLRKLTHWTARFLGATIINPHAPNKDWADSSQTVSALLELGIVGGDGEDLEGFSWLKDREIGEVVGEFVFGAGKNPFRDNELLLPKNWERLLEKTTE